MPIDADADAIGALDASHCGVHLPEGCVKTLTVRTGPPGCKPLSFKVQIAQIEVEEVAVDAAGAADDLQRVGQLGQQTSIDLAC